ncbi:hypothetical protein [Streptomyces sp. NBC_01233]|uniref:hypothetical protein n=1 Tax=Streptomyces sp. NBC_01233 TaxID=2903787 RepID=UPI002E129D3F|nr:hypothetical protein OG332_18220 [Streptomyces sp. NBC_01233]
MPDQHTASGELTALACRLAEQRDPPTHPLWGLFAALFTVEVGRAPIPTDLYACLACPCHF